MDLDHGPAIILVVSNLYDYQTFHFDLCIFVFPVLVNRLQLLKKGCKTRWKEE